MDYIIGLMGDPVAWVALFTLVAMEVVLGIDNLIFIAVLSNKLPPEQRSRARRTGIAVALVLRLALLATLAFIVKLTTPVLEFSTVKLSWRDIILVAGGLFLVWKATREIHHIVDPDTGPAEYDDTPARVSYAAVIAQILLLDIIFSVDSIITAVGMTPHVPIMVVAVVVAVLCMLLAADPLSDFIARNPTVVMLALGFLLLIGTTLIADGFGVHIPRGYIYAAMAFSALIEGLNILARRAKRRGQHPQDGARP